MNNGAKSFVTVTGCGKISLVRGLMLIMLIIRNKEINAHHLGVRRLRMILKGLTEAENRVSSSWTLTTLSFIREQAS